MVVLLFVIDGGGKLLVSSHEDPRKPRPGHTVMSLIPPQSPEGAQTTRQGEAVAN